MAFAMGNWMEMDPYAFTQSTYRCPACGTMTVLPLGIAYGIDGVWICTHCYRQWGVQTRVPVFEVR